MAVRPMNAVELEAHCKAVKAAEERRREEKEAGWRPMIDNLIPKIIQAFHNAVMKDGVPSTDRFIRFTVCMEGPNADAKETCMRTALMKRLLKETFAASGWCIDMAWYSHATTQVRTRFTVWPNVAE
jgi:hypothetical protein